LARRWPELREHLFTDEGALSRRAAIYVDGRDVRWLPDAEATRLSEDQCVAVIPPAAGG
jgi:molybdopterin converting factor small subunit